MVLSPTEPEGGEKEDLKEVHGATTAEGLLENLQQIGKIETGLILSRAEVPTQEAAEERPNETNMQELKDSEARIV